MSDKPSYEELVNGDGDTVECWNCGGLGMTPGCFEDCCSGADCDPDDAETCCSPRRCDVCRGRGGWPREALSRTKDNPNG